MNNKGFAITTIIYAIIILISIIMLSILALMKTEYINQKDLVDDIRDNLEICLEDGGC